MHQELFSRKLKRQKSVVLQWSQLVFEPTVLFPTKSIERTVRRSEGAGARPDQSSSSDRRKSINLFCRTAESLSQTPLLIGQNIVYTKVYEASAIRLASPGIVFTFWRSIMSRRPPPLRTSGTFDDDEYFNSVALNMLARYQALNLSSSETIRSSLPSAKIRASFFEGMCSRLARASGMPPSIQTLLLSTKEAFGDELNVMVESENHFQVHTSFPSGNGVDSLPPITPRHTAKSFASRVFGQSSTKKNNRSFFPDGDSKPGLFRTRKVQNIDWKMAEAIQQVQTLRLDGQNSPQKRLRAYEPPQLG